MNLFKVKKIKQKNNQYGGGFSLPELLTTVTMLSIIVVISLADYPAFNRKLSLKRTAYEITSVIREAQLSGIAGRQVGSSYPAFGVYFDINTPKTLILFTDNNKDEVYSGAGEDFEKFNIQTSDSISALCGDKITPTDICGIDSGTAVSQLHVVYERPGPLVSLLDDAFISHNLNIDIEISSPKGETIAVRVRPGGVVSVSDIY